ncbi:hypothetical protein [Streptomyces sp. NPDC008139]|uniref:hypothetical protein n=1 Tax=Streptomyces sp. NPDC008139 TaxID=3364814 RepID=UPI0036E152B4
MTGGSISGSRKARISNFLAGKFPLASTYAAGAPMITASAATTTAIRRVFQIVSRRYGSSKNRC